MEKSQVVNQNRIFTSISSSAEEKYLQFIENPPTIFNRLPLHMVASYLGVTRETLSRIRRYPVNK
jgi:CRP/FNR family transcriptional regulator, anaerobic regulatory protein